LWHGSGAIYGREWTEYNTRKGNTSASPSTCFELPAARKGIDRKSFRSFAMSTSLVTFSFVSQSVRVNVIDDAPWFCLRDVCEVLAIQNPRQLDLDEKGVCKTYTLTNGGMQPLKFINEPNLYRVIFRSNKPEARKFQDWVFDTVLPTLRATGGFHTKPVALLTKAQRKEVTDQVKVAVELIGYQDAAKHAIYSRLRKELGVEAVHHLTQEQFKPALAIIAESRRALQHFNDVVGRTERTYVRSLAFGKPQQLRLT
jgi:prophage antirepressor-like protein